MKRIFAISLAMLLLCGCMLFAACGKTPIPQGYQLYDNGAISFAYPNTWTKKGVGAVILVNETGVGNNITVVYEPKTDFYATMDEASFNEQMRPSIEAMGMTVTSVSVEQTKNANGVKITKIAYTSEYEAVQMKQTLFITEVGDQTYSVTVTEATPDAVLVENVFNTLDVK